jgi:predicted RNA-binding protein with RPS1 domain/DNA-binding NarL/FixJ family response regulator
MRGDLDMSDSSNDKAALAELKVGNRLTGIVYRILSDRILLHLPGGIHGIIRQREMSWDNANADPASLVQLQQCIEAVVIKIDAEQKSAELSLRFAQHDPWQDLFKRYRVHDVVDGIVQDVRGFGAFVAIEPGVEGLIRVSEIRLGSQIEEAQEALWIGDHVRTVITDINVPQRHLALSIKEYLQYHHSLEKLSHRERGQLRLADRLSPSVLHKLRQTFGDLTEAVSRPEPGRIQTILVVDDYREFRQSLVQLLRSWRYVVDEAENEEETHAYVAQKRYDLIILDFYLGRGVTLALAKEIHAAHPGSEILLLSGAEVTEDDKQQATAQRMIFDYKPYGADRLAALLRQLETGVAIPTTLQKSAQYRLLPTRLPLVPDTDISGMLQTLINQTSAKGAVLFALDETKSGEIKWLYHYGIKVTSTRDVHTTLLYSPVGDVIREQQRVIIRNTADRPEQSKYLQQAIAFRSCIGIPVYIFSQYRPYALFIFSDKPSAFSEQDYDVLQRTAEALGVLLFRQRVFNIFLERQEELVTVQVVETEITPLLAPSERWRGVERGPLHHVEPLHTLW